MKIALVGYGKMGSMLHSICRERGHQVVSIDPLVAEADFREINSASLSEADACIDFSHPAAAIDNIKKIVRLKKNLVVGTTGWYQQMEEIRDLVAKNQIGFIYAANFSIGVNIFYRLVERAAQIFNGIDSYDVSGLEYHHNQKADSPSGTAQSLANILLKEISWKEHPVYDRLDRKIAPDELHFPSVRCGSMPGTHEVVFDSEADTISLRHTARSRLGFAYGAVLAAEWINQKRGFFEIDDFMDDLSKQRS